jgi:hypothetical protein
MKPEHQLYFAYGSNLLRSQISERCPDHTEIGIGILKNYRVSIGGRGVATIVPDPTNNTYGFVYQLSPEDVSKLDIKEGVAIGYYKQDRQLVKIADSIKICLVYIEPIYTPGKPSFEYLNKIIDGAIEHNLPAEYVNQLRALA